MNVGVRLEGEEILMKKALKLERALSSDELTLALTAGAKVVEAAAKANMGGPGPNRRTGTLSRSITTQPVGPGEVEVGTNLIYAPVHEFGATIEAKNAPFLVFQTDDGQWHQVKSVTIPPRPYLRPAFDENKDRAVDAVMAAGKALILKAAA